LSQASRGIKDAHKQKEKSHAKLISKLAQTTTTKGHTQIAKRLFKNNVSKKGTMHKHQLCLIIDQRF
jgi:4-hydroxy-3-methylbut-2-enyl diphosphate reductase IspH